MLSEAAAKALAEHQGSLFLDGLTTLSDAAATALAQHQGDLALNGLTTVSDTTAKALALHQGSLSLYGLRQFSVETVNDRLILPTERSSQILHPVDLTPRSEG